MSDKVRSVRILDNSNFIIGVIVVFGVLLSSLSGWLLLKAEEKTIYQEFQRDVDNRAASLSRQLFINLETLNTLSILFRNGTEPSYEQFTYEASKILARHNDIQALEYIPRINHKDRGSYEEKIKKIFPGFEITERRSQGEMVTAKERSEYFPVYYVHPYIGNEPALGFDLASNETRLKTLEKSRDTATSIATAKITLVQGDEQNTGFLAFVPLYLENFSTLEKRRTALKGFVLGVFNVESIFKSSILADETDGISLTLLDVTSVDDRAVLFSQKPGSSGVIKKEMHYEKKLITFWGRQWILSAEPTQDYVIVRRDVLPWVIFTAGLLFTGLLAFYTRNISNRTLQVERLVEEKTQEINAAYKKLEKLSITDGLTGVANRRKLDDFLAKEWLRSMRNNRVISFLLIDVDFFKLYNDTYGHIAGDECLKKIADVIEQSSQRLGSDLIARYGGEEFAVVLSETTDAIVVANKCREAVEDLQIPHSHSEISNVVTISIGAATLTPSRGDLVDVLIKFADDALYQAKEKGRNRIEQYLENNK